MCSDDTGIALAERGDFRKALKYFDMAIVKEPETSVLFEMRAQLLMELGHYFHAVQAADKVFDIISTS